MTKRYTREERLSMAAPRAVPAVEAMRRVRLAIEREMRGLADAPPGTRDRGRAALRALLSEVDGWTRDLGFGWEQSADGCDHG